MKELELVEAVYYPAQVPPLPTLTLLACVFDRIHFPGVYLPAEMDEIATRKEIERLKTLSIVDNEQPQMMECMAFALVRHHVTDLCHFTGSLDISKCVEPDAGAVAWNIHEALFGPFPEGFYPTWNVSFTKGLPGGGCIVAPGAFTYPASALLYAARLGLPVISDDPSFPLPALPIGAVKNHTKLLTSILAIECVKLVLPRVPILLPSDLAELRAETASLVKPFRLELLRLAVELNTMLASDATLSELQRTAQLVAETRVYPQLEEVRATVENPAKPWHKRAVALFNDVPELAHSFVSEPKHIAIAKTMRKVMTVFADLRDERLDAANQRSRHNFQYLLRLPMVVAKHS